MTISKLIKTLQDAQRHFGDIPVTLMNEETGDWQPLAEVAKGHPICSRGGGMDRKQAVDKITLFRLRGAAPDLLLASTPSPWLDDER